jgi:hypothetical protein
LSTLSDCSAAASSHNLKRQFPFFTVPPSLLRFARCLDAAPLVHVVFSPGQIIFWEAALGLAPIGERGATMSYYLYQLTYSKNAAMADVAFIHKRIQMEKGDLQ